MVHGASGSGSRLPPAPSRKRKWNSTNVTRIDFGDIDSGDISTAVVQQATRDGRRIEHTFHSIPIPRDPRTVEPSDYVPADDMDFDIYTLNEDGADDAETPDYVCSHSL